MSDKTLKQYGKTRILPKTAQTVSKADYDDGYYQKGSPASPRFVDNGDGTISDKVTGLMWVKDSTGAGCNNGNLISWANALTFCKNLNFAGHTDWRLPNAMELFSIFDFSVNNPAINTAYFTNMQSGNPQYWTGTFVKAYETEGYKWEACYGSGRMDEGTGATCYVRPVRGGV